MRAGVAGTALTFVLIAAAGASAQVPPSSTTSAPAQQAAAALGVPGRPKIVIAGDSTAAEYGPDRYPQLGWGQVLKCSLDGEVDVLNAARGGRSTKSFIAEGWFSDMMKQVAPGDTVLIQFGHNDAAVGRPERFTEPEGDFRELLRAYVAVTRARRAVPVLITPVTRRQWVNGAVRESHAPYARVVRQVAAETRTPLIDLSATSRSLVQRLGEEPSKRYYLHYTASDGIARYPQGVIDDTHFSEQGARAMAALVAEGLRATGAPVAAHLRPVNAPATPPVLGGSGCP